MLFDAEMYSKKTDYDEWLDEDALFGLEAKSMLGFRSLDEVKNEELSAGTIALIIIILLVTIGSLAMFGYMIYTYKKKENDLTYRI